MPGPDFSRETILYTAHSAQQRWDAARAATKKENEK